MNNKTYPARSSELLLHRDSHKVLHQLALCEQLRGGSVSDIVGLWLAEDVIAHGMADESSKVDHIQTDLLGEVFEWPLFTNWQRLSDLEAVHCLQTETVVGLWRLAS